jgi:hypothetical protein
MEDKLFLCINFPLCCLRTTNFVFDYIRAWSPDIIRQIKPRRMRWAGHVARMGEERKM